MAVSFAIQQARFEQYDTAIVGRLALPEFEHIDRRKALALCRRLYRIVVRRRGAGFADAVSEVAGGAARRGLAPRTVYRLVGLALSHLGMDVPVGLGRSLKQFMFEGA
jgi:hypothetical protein